MNTTFESTGKLTGELHLLIEPQDYQGLVKDELKKQAKKANIPGFRKGKVPIGMVRRMVGKSVVIDVVSNMVNRSVNEYIQAENLNLLGEPLPTEEKSEDDFDPNAEKEIKFSFELGLAPELELNLNLDEVPVRYAVEVDDEFLHEQLDHYRERFGGVTNPEEVAEGDIFYGRLYEVDETGEEVEGEAAFSQMVPFNPTRIQREEFFQPYLGAKVEDTFAFDLSQVSDSDDEIAELLFIDKEKVEDIKGKALKLQVKRINRLGKAEFNEEFFQRMAQEFGWEASDIEGMDEASFKAKMKESLAAPQQNDALWFYRNKLRDAVLANHPLEFPDDFLQRWLLHSNKEMDEAKLQEEYPAYIRSLTWSLIVDKIMEQNPEMEVGEADVSEELLRNIRMQFARMGSALPPDREQEFLQMAMQNQEMVNNAIQSVVATKAFDYLETQITPPTETISATAFRQLIEEEEAQKAETQGETEAETEAEGE